MTLVQAVLPDLDGLDAEALRALVLEKHTELISYKTELISYKQEIENLKLLTAKFRRMQFGRKSEKAVAADRATGIAIGRSRDETGEARNQRPQQRGNAGETGTATLTSGTVTRDGVAGTERGMLPGLWWTTGPSRRRRIRNAGIRTGQV